MPSGEKLPQPEGSNSWNDRYFLYVAEFLGERIKEEVEAYCLKAPNFTTNLVDAWRVVEKLQGIYLDFELYHFNKEEQRWMCRFVTPLKNVKAFAGTAQEAICIAALMVFDIEVESCS